MANDNQGSGKGGPSQLEMELHEKYLTEIGEVKEKHQEEIETLREGFQQSLKDVNGMYDERLGKANAETEGLKKKIKELEGDEKKEETPKEQGYPKESETRTLQGIVPLSPVQPVKVKPVEPDEEMDKKAEGIYIRATNHTIMRSVVANIDRQNKLVERAKKENVPERITREIISIAAKDSAFYDSMFRKAEELDEKAEALDAKLKEAEGVEGKLAELKKEEEKIGMQNKELQETIQNAENIIAKELDVAQREKTVDELEKTLKALATEYRMFLTKTLKLQDRIENHSKKLLAGMSDNIGTYKRRITNIQKNYAESASIILLGTYARKLGVKEDKIPLHIEEGIGEPKIGRKLESLASSAPRDKDFVTGSDEQLGQYVIVPIVTEGGAPIAYFCVLGPKEEKMSELREVASSVSRTLLEHYALLHLVSEDGELGYNKGRLETFGKDLDKLTKLSS